MGDARGRADALGARARRCCTRPALHALAGAVAPSPTRRTSRRAAERRRRTARAIVAAAHRVPARRARGSRWRRPRCRPPTHTNAYVLGNGELLIVDPGAADVRQYAKLLALVAGPEGGGDAAGGGGAHPPPRRPRRRRARGEGAAGHPALVPRAHGGPAGLPGGAAAGGRRRAGARGQVPQRWRVLHTPGHARGHVCLVDERSQRGGGGGHGGAAWAPSSSTRRRATWRTTWRSSRG